MTEKQLKEFRSAAKAVARKHRSSRKKALDFLRRSGVLTASGRLTARYGGGPKP